MDGDNAGAPPFAGGFGNSRQTSSHLTTLHEHHNEHMNSAGSILCTQEAMDQAVMHFSEHVDTCNVTFKQEIMSKVKDLKRGDTQVLTERVS